MYVFMELNFKGEIFTCRPVFLLQHSLLHCILLWYFTHAYSDTFVRSAQSFREGPLNVAAAAADELDDE
jgi:hypothetical protein